MKTNIILFMKHKKKILNIKMVFYVKFLSKSVIFNILIMYSKKKDDIYLLSMKINKGSTKKKRFFNFPSMIELQLVDVHKRRPLFYRYF